MKQTNYIRAIEPSRIVQGPYLGREFMTEFDPRDLAMRPDPDEAHELPMHQERGWHNRRKIVGVMDRRWR